MNKLIPNVLGAEVVAEDEVLLVLEIASDLACLSGHFPENPLVPGVAQVHWADYFARQYLGSAMPPEHNFCSLEVIKFQNIIRPEKEITLRLNMHTAKSKLYFHYSDKQTVFSSGRMLYQIV